MNRILQILCEKQDEILAPVRAASELIGYNPSFSRTKTKFLLCVDTPVSILTKSFMLVLPRAYLGGGKDDYIQGNDLDRFLRYWMDIPM